MGDDGVPGFYVIGSIGRDKGVRRLGFKKVGYQLSFLSCSRGSHGSGALQWVVGCMVSVGLGVISSVGLSWCYVVGAVVLVGLVGCGVRLFLMGGHSRQVFMWDMMSVIISLLFVQ